jgi:hypothetical protein
VALKDLVDLRNGLVHRLIERFDVRTEDGCAAASEHLNGCYERIGRHFQELRQLAETVDQGRAETVAFIQSESFLEFVVNGIAPDGSFEWPNTGIVRVLRAALDVHAVHAWVHLDDAKAWIEEKHPEQTPEKYGCRTWPQVLHESRCFELKYRLDEDGQKVAGYRAR